jgi:hypothetical protein
MLASDAVQKPLQIVSTDSSDDSISQNILQVLLALGDYMNVQCHACIGGTNIGEDIRKLDYGQHVVSGTPGRVFGKNSFPLYM